MPLGNTAQFPQGVLQPLAEALEALRIADRKRLPVRVRQHKVINQMLEPSPAKRHAQLGHVRKVRRTKPPGVMHLGKEHLLARPFQAPPTLDLTLEGSQLAVRKPPRFR